MITWVTHRSFSTTAATLDDNTLGQTKEDVVKLLDMLTTDTADEHPMMYAWIGYEYALGIYGMLLSMEWYMHRGFADNDFFKIKRVLDELRSAEGVITYKPPPWLADTDFMSSHRSNLRRLDPKFYGKLFPATKPDMPYLFPVIDETDAPRFDRWTLTVSDVDKERLRKGERKLAASAKKRVVNL